MKTEFIKTVTKYFLGGLFIFLELTLAPQAFPQTGLISDTIRLNYKTKESLDTNFFNIFPKKVNKIQVGLVLSGGGARGISQLGVLSVLNEHNVEIDRVTGTSIGAVTGGLYSAGYSPENIKEIFKNVDWVNTLSLSDKHQRQYLFLDQKNIQDKSLLTISIDGLTPTLPSSISSGQKLTELVNILVLNAKYHTKKSFNDLKIPLAVVATDFDKGEKVILQDGNLSESIKASFTFPLLYSSININGKNLVDGGLTANIPVSISKEMGSNFIITVNSTSPLRKREEITNPLYTADHILSITMNQLNNSQLQNSNIVITPEISNTSSFDFEKIDYLYQKGREAAEKEVDKIIAGIDSTEVASSQYFNNFLINASSKLTITGVTPGENFSTIINQFKDEKFIRYTEIEQKLKQLYRTGYFSSVEAQITGETNGATINFMAHSNEVLENVVSNSSYPFLTNKINEFKLQNKNTVLNLNKCFKFYENLLQELRENNLSLVEIDKFYFNHASGTLEVYFTEGRIDSLEISGNKKSNDNLILREISFENNEPVKKDDLEKSLKNVIGTNLFKQVSFDFDFSKKKFHPNMKIRVVERSARNIRISGRVDNERNLQGFFDIRDENLFGTGLETGAFIAGGLRNQNFEFEFKSNQLFKSPLTYDLSYYTGFRNIYEYKTEIDNDKNEYERTQTSEYKNKKTGYSILVGLQAEKLGTIYGKFSFEYLAALDLSPANTLREEYNTLKFVFGGNFDSRDILPYPSSGSLLNFYYETAQNKLGTDITYSKLFINYEQYFSLGKLHTIKPRFIFGSADKTAPLPEFFSIGGENSFFGMVEDENTGRQVLELSMEYRFKSPYKLFFDTYLKTRYDLGRIWENTTDIKFKDLRHGIGASICFDTPVGESSFSVGKTFLIQKGLSKDSFIFGPYTYYFSIGYKF
ncbi:MAG: patatin-like phospholipase family protein [Bacteroidetes bacterium]|nr:patatin-like phospholipase family protein [Bacteroidota bacterium]